jgi:release factor glutamine methyltransferase
MQPRTEQPWTVGRLLSWTIDFLARKGIESARLDAQVLLAHALGCKRIDLYGVRFAEEASEEDRQRFRELVRRRVEGCPVAYLVGRKEFFSLEFEVGPAVLIPRPDTEELVCECLRLAKPLPEPAILDLGTGSGNVPVALAKHHKTARLTTVDISPEALALARRNAEKHAVADRITFLQGDLFEPLPAGERFGFVVSNPPYIPTSEISKLEIGVRDYEPHRALDGGPDGFAVFDRIIRQAPAVLKPGGYLIVEIGAPQEAEARRRIEAIAGYDLGPTVKDGSGHPRVLRARLAG